MLLKVSLAEFLQKYVMYVFRLFLKTRVIENHAIRQKTKSSSA